MDETMKKERIEGTYTLQLPETFEVMSAEELQEMYRKGDPFRWGARDRENHRTVLAMRKEIPVILVPLVNLKAVARRNEQLTRRISEGHGYRLLEFISMKAGQEETEGYRFIGENEAGTAQAYSVFLLRNGRAIWSFVFAGREENLAADSEAAGRIMGTLERA